MMRLSLALPIACLATACTAAEKNTRYMQEEEYQSRPALSQALLGANETLDESAVRKILDSKVSLPKKINLAVVRLTDSSDGIDMQTIDRELAERFFEPASWGSRVQSVIPVPTLLLPKPVNLAALRRAAVFLQADALLVVKPATLSNWKYEAFHENKAKGMTSLEVLLLDMRTSVIPYTSLVTETVELEKERGDYSEGELVLRARKASESKALLRVPAALSRFFGA